MTSGKSRPMALRPNSFATASTVPAPQKGSITVSSPGRRRTAHFSTEEVAVVPIPVELWRLASAPLWIQFPSSNQDSNPEKMTNKRPFAWMFCWSNQKITKTCQVHNKLPSSGWVWVPSPRYLGWYFPGRPPHPPLQLRCPPWLRRGDPWRSTGGG